MKNKFSSAIISMDGLAAGLGIIIQMAYVILSILGNEIPFEVFILGIVSFTTLGIGIIFEIEIEDRYNYLIRKNPELKHVFEQETKDASKEKWYWFLGIVAIMAIVIVTKIWWIAPAILVVSLCWNTKWLRFIKSLESKR